MPKLGLDNEHYTYNTHNILYLLALSTHSNRGLLKHSTIVAVRTVRRLQRGCAQRGAAAVAARLGITLVPVR